MAGVALYETHGAGEGIGGMGVLLGHRDIGDAVNH